MLFLWIDEAQHTIDRKNPEDMRDIRDTLKTLLENPEWPIYVVLSGLPHFSSVIEHKTEKGVPDENDVQVIRRYRFWCLPDLDLSIERDVIAQIIATAASTASLTMAIHLDGDFIDRLYHAALRQFGLSIELTNEAIEVALVAGDQELSLIHFIQCYAERTGSALSANPFAVMNWRELDCCRVLAKDEEDESEDGGPAKKGDRPW